MFSEFLEGREIKQNDKLERKQTKKKLKTCRKNLQQVIEERDDFKNKYLALLEEKSESFDKYLLWQDKAKEAMADEKEIRKEFTDYKRDVRIYEELVGRLFVKEEITSLAKCEDFDDFLIYALRLYFTDKDLPLKGIKETCKKLEITKRMIKKQSTYLYEKLNVDKWDIEEG